MPRSRVSEIGNKGVIADISKSGSHLGEATTKDENYKGCELYGFMDYVLEKSNDCKKIEWYYQIRFYIIDNNWSIFVEAKDEGDQSSTTL